jgi:hypothetical protein
MAANLFYLGPTLVIYLLLGIGVAIAVYVSDGGRTLSVRLFTVITAIPFWPLYVPVLLAGRAAAEKHEPENTSTPADDEMATAIRQVDAELEAALNSLDGWAEDVLAREKDRIHELRGAWKLQSERIREMDRLLSRPDANGNGMGPNWDNAASEPARERLQHTLRARQQNIERLRQVRRRAYEDLMGTLAWVRELVSMIHLAKFTGAPAARAEELVAQIAAAVEGLSELTWQEEPAPIGGNESAFRERPA